MGPNDSTKTAFTIDDVVYYYFKMPISLKNVRATFEILMINEVFVHQMGRNLEAYVYNSIVKSMTFENQENFQSLLLKYEAKPDKCSFFCWNN